MDKNIGDKDKRFDSRLLFVFLIFWILLLLIFGATIKLKVVERDEWVELEKKRILQKREYKAKRGNIYSIDPDNGEYLLLATNEPLYDVYVDLGKAKRKEKGKEIIDYVIKDSSYNKGINALCDSLAYMLKDRKNAKTSTEYKNYFNEKRKKNQRYVAVAKKVSKEELEYEEIPRYEAEEIVRTVFEDMGYFCVDNLPAPLIPKFAELCLQSAGKVDKMALVIDIRGDLFLNELNRNLDELRKMEIPYQILFLEASDDVLIQRFKETRRNHPLSPQGTVSDGIAKEREKLSELRGRADKIMDTSRMKVSEFRTELRNQWEGISDKLSISIITFGYKHGVPIDTDLLMDVRFMPNPYYIPELRPLTGRDPAVQDYVYETKECQEFIEKYMDLLHFLLPNYIKEGKTHLTVGIGCTGGQHRSIAIGIKIGQMLQAEGYPVNLRHRDN